ncbi:hypothetical protein TcCL_ESM05701 [Trypanosoma cruzi]|nr:hypothetical protein TcCL_ESM05701 [Trypanosoma cruzi]
MKVTGGSEPSPLPLPPSTSQLVCEKQMVRNQPGEFLYKRQEVLAYIKSFLQPAYDRGSLSCQQFVSIAKQTLLFVMSARDIGMQGFSKDFVAQVVQLQMTHVPHTTAPTTPMSTPLVECKKGGHIPYLHAQPGDHHNDDNEARGEKEKQQQQQLSLPTGNRQASPFMLRNGHDVGTVNGINNGSGNQLFLRDPSPRSYEFPSPFTQHSKPSCSFQGGATKSQNGSNNRNTVTAAALPALGDSTCCVTSSSLDAYHPHKVTTTAAETRTDLSTEVAMKSSSPITMKANKHRHSYAGKKGDEKEKVEKQSQISNNTSDKLLFVLEKLRERLSSWQSIENNAYSSLSQCRMADGSVGVAVTSPTHSSGLDEIRHVRSEIRDVLRLWILERREILREEEQVFTSLFLHFQHALIKDLIRHVFKTEGVVGVSLPPPPTTPPPKVQFERVSLLRGNDGGNDDPYGKCCGNSPVLHGATQLVYIEDEGPEADVSPAGNTTAPKSLYRRQFLHHHNDTGKKKTSRAASIRRDGSCHSHSGRFGTQGEAKRRSERKRLMEQLNEGSSSLPSSVLPCSSPLRRQCTVPTVSVTERNGDWDDVRDVLMTPSRQYPPHAVFPNRYATTPKRTSRMRRETMTPPKSKTATAVFRLHSPKSSTAKPAGVNVQPQGQGEGVQVFTKQRPNLQEETRSEVTKRGSAGALVQQIDRKVIVEYLRQLLQPAFDSGALSVDQMGGIVQRAAGPLLSGKMGHFLASETRWKNELRKQVEHLLGEALLGKP